MDFSSHPRDIATAMAAAELQTSQTVAQICPRPPTSSPSKRMANQAMDVMEEH
jgi:hypothetical protein